MTCKWSWKGWIAACFVVIGLCQLASAETGPEPTYYSGNYWSPYPPGCVTVPLRQLDLYGENVAKIYDGIIELDLTAEVLSVDPSQYLKPVLMKMFRVGCAEPDRSIILVEFSLPEPLADPRYGQVKLPDFVGSTAMHGFPFMLKPEPNTYGQSIKQQALSQRAFGDYTGGWDDPQRFTWRYILDVTPVGWYWGPWMAEYYNGAFGLEIKLESGYKSVMLVPSTRSVLSSNQQLPLNGRLSGNWIEANTRDQGFVLSISTLLPPSVSADLPPEDADQLLFLGWYTFGASGEMLWLTAAATVPQGSSEAEFEFVKVEAGQFLGNHNATRSKVGSGRIKARNCNSLEFEYDLTGLGLGTGGMKLQRIFALEIAGYHCRDYAARLASISAGGE